MRGFVPTQDRRPIALEARHLLLDLRDLLLLVGQVAVDDSRLSHELEDLFLEPGDHALELLLRLLDGDGLVDLAEHQQQDDRAESAGDDVEEGEAEDL